MLASHEKLKCGDSEADFIKSMHVSTCVGVFTFMMKTTRVGYLKNDVKILSIIKLIDSFE